MNDDHQKSANARAMVKTAGSRVSHSKSRKGCKQCKRRRIKCDETRPSCLKCVKHSIVCDFAIAQPSDPTSAPPELSPQSTSDDSTHANLITEQKDCDNTTLTMADVELFHNFCTSTYLTLSNIPSVQMLWQNAVPKIAYSSNYVMHGILAISALHLAKLQPEMKDALVSQAMVHYSHAIGMARPAVASISAENALAVYVFSTVAVIYALASPRSSENLLFVENENIAEWLYLQRGTLAIIAEFVEILHNSILRPMFHEGKKRADNRARITNKNVHLQAFELHLQRTVQDTTVLDVYLQSTTELHKTLAGRFDIEQGISEATDTFHWPIRVPYDYLILLRKQRSEALIILAFYCVALHSTRHLWWLEGCGYHLIEQIYNQLQEQDRLFLRWPIAEIGWSMR